MRLQDKARGGTRDTSKDDAKSAAHGAGGLDDVSADTTTIAVHYDASTGVLAFADGTHEDVCGTDKVADKDDENACRNADGTYPFDVLITPLWHELVQYALGLEHDSRARAEDVVQDAFVRALKAWPTWKPAEDVPVHVAARAWIYRIVANTFINIYQHRRYWHGRLKVLAAMPGARHAEIEIPDEVPEYLREAIEDLPAERRTVVELCDLEGLSHEEVARRLGIPKNTVDTRLHRAHAQMRASLARQVVDPCGNSLPAVVRRRRRAR